MRKKLFWGSLAALLCALLLGACVGPGALRSLICGVGKPGAAAVGFVEPEGVEHSVCRVAYAALSPVQRQAYRAVYNAVPAHPKRIALPYMSQDALYEVMSALKLENPHILCLGEQFSYRAVGRTLWLYPTYNGAAAECAARTSALLKTASSFAAAANACSDDYEKELCLHDAICAACAYGDGDFADTAYGALALGRATCGGYAAAMKLLCDLAGVRSTVVRGEASARGEPEMHIWNAVALDGVWYYTDVTWDDPSGARAPRHDYLNVSETELSRTHSGASLPAGLRVTGGSGDYYIRQGLFCNETNWKHVLCAALARLGSGDALEVKFSSAQLYKAVSDALFSGGVLQELASPYLNEETVQCTYSGTDDVRVLHIRVGK